LLFLLDFEEYRGKPPSMAFISDFCQKSACQSPRSEPKNRLANALERFAQFENHRQTLPLTGANREMRSRARRSVENGSTRIFGIARNGL
jgi:hypothetical protein